MILLLLGLALVLATSSSLLAANGSGREDEDRDETRSSSNPQLMGEIAGSVSVTGLGDVWITILIDELSILAQLEVIESTSEEGYRFSIVSIAAPLGELGAVSPHLIPFIAQEKRVTEFSTKKEATNKIIQLFDDLGITISQESIKSIPYVISCGWRNPTECQQLVKNILEGKNCGDS